LRPAALSGKNRPFVFRRAEAAADGEARTFSMTFAIEQSETTITRRAVPAGVLLLSCLLLSRP
jgi:hypothetical protein